METKQEKYSFPPNGKAAFPFSPTSGKEIKLVLADEGWVPPRFPMEKGEATKLRAEAGVRGSVWKAIDERWSEMQAMVEKEDFPYDARRKLRKAINPSELRIQLELKRQMDLKDQLMNDLDEWFNK